MANEVRIPVTLLRRAGAEYVGRVQYQGERIIITNRGKDVAVLAPISDLIDGQATKPKSKKS